jgi:hypothetical protein
MRAAAMRCCASKRSTSTRSEAGGDATPKAGIESGVAARAGAHSISIRVVDSEDESRAPRGWPGGADPCSSDDGGARTSTSAFAEGCVAVDADAVARSIATELLMTRTSDRRDVFSVRRSGTVSAMDTDVEIDLEAGNGGAVSCGDTVTEPDETTRLLAGAAAAAYSSLPSSSDEDAKSSRSRRGRDERSDLSRATTSTRDYGVNTDLSDDGARGGVHARRRRGRAAVTPVTAVLLTACAVAGCALYSLDPSLSSAASAYRIFTGRMNAAHGDDAGVEIVSAESAAEVLVPTAATTMKAKAAPKEAKMKMKRADHSVDAPSARERFAAAFSAALDSDAASSASRTHRTHSSSHHHDGEGKSVHDKSVHEREPAKKSGEASSSSGHHAPSGHHAHAEPAPSGSKHAKLAGLGRSRRGTFERVAGACAANVPNGDVRRGRFQFEDASCAEGAFSGADTAVHSRGGCARLHRHHSRTHGSGKHVGSSHAELGCRFCVLHGSQREDDDDDDDYSPLLDPLAWSVDYEACPRDVCVTHDLRATLCDPD